MPQNGAEAPRICVVYGALRSGTTVFRLMLHGHPRIAAPGESDFLVDYLVRDAQGRLCYDLDKLADDRMFRAAGIPRPSASDASTAFGEMTDALKAGVDGPLVLILHRHLPGLLELLPADAPVLHLLRDPRDVARSAIGIGLAGNSFYGADSWIETERAWDDAASLLADRPVRELHYERLLEDPEGMLRQIVAFLGVEYDDKLLSYPEWSTYDPPDASLATQWQRKLPAREVALIEARIGPLLTARGYEPSGEAAIRLTRPRRVSLWLDHTRGKWRWRFRNFGIVDPLLTAIGRRPGMSWIARQANKRMEQRLTTLLK